MSNYLCGRENFTSLDSVEIQILTVNCWNWIPKEISLVTLQCDKIINGLKLVAWDQKNYFTISLKKITKAELASLINNDPCYPYTDTKECHRKWNFIA